MGLLGTLIAQAAPAAPGGGGLNIGANFVGWLLGVPLVVVLIFVAIHILGKAGKGKVGEAFGVLVCVLCGLIIVGLAKDPATLANLSGGLVKFVFNL